MIILPKFYIYVDIELHRGLGWADLDLPFLTNCLLTLGCGELLGKLPAGLLSSHGCRKPLLTLQHCAHWTKMLFTFGRSVSACVSSSWLLSSCTLSNSSFPQLASAALLQAFLRSATVLHFELPFIFCHLGCFFQFSLPLLLCFLGFARCFCSCLVKVFSAWDFFQALQKDMSRVRIIWPTVLVLC